MTFLIFQIINNYKRISIGEIMLSFREFLNETSGTTRTTVKPKNRRELYDIIEETIEEQGNNCDLNFIDTSLITDMSELFSDFAEFNGDISGWDVSSVKKMNRMFYGSKFTGDISKWDVSKVVDMNRLFRDSKFNGDISKWNTSKVENMEQMFYGSKFTGDISKWNTSKVENMAFMFSASVFNGDISEWNVSKVKDMHEMFYDSPLEGHEPDWYDLIY